MSTRLKSALLINLICLLVVASVTALALPFLYQQQKNNTEKEVTTALSLFEISARRAVNIQNKPVLKELAEELLKSPSVNYVKVTDQSSREVMVEAGTPRKKQQNDGKQTNKLAAQVDNQQRPSSQINPIAWVEIEFSSPSSVYQWLLPHRLVVFRLLAGILLLQIVLSVFVSRMFTTASTNPKPTPKPIKPTVNKPTPPKQEPIISSSKTAVEITNAKLSKELQTAKAQHKKDKHKVKQLVELSNRANSLKKALLEHANNAAFIVDEHNHVIEASTIGRNYLNVSKDKLININLNKHYSVPKQNETQDGEFMELLVSYPEEFCLLVRANKTGKTYAATHLALPFSEDSLYLVSINPIHQQEQLTQHKQSPKHLLQQLMPSDLYTPLKAGCLDALNQLNKASLLAPTEYSNRERLDAQLRLSTLLRSLPWQQQQDTSIKCKSESVLEILEQRLAQFSALFQAKNLHWALVVSPEISQQYMLNRPHLIAILDLQLYLISLYPSNSQVLVQLQVEEQQLVFSVDSENAGQLSALQQSIIALSAALVKQINGRQQQNQDSLSLCLNYQAVASDQLVESPSEDMQYFALDFADEFFQRCLSIQLQLLSAEVIDLKKLDEVAAKHSVTVISDKPELTLELEDQGIKLNVLLVAEQLPSSAQYDSSLKPLFCLKPQLCSFLMASFFQQKSNTQEQQTIEDLAQVAIAAASEDEATTPSSFSIASFSQSKHRFEHLNTQVGDIALKWQHRAWQEAYNQIKNLGTVDYLLLESSELTTVRIQQIQQYKPELRLLLLVNNVEDLDVTRLAGLHYYLLSESNIENDIRDVLVLNQHFGQALEGLCADEQLLSSHAISEYSFLRLIENLSGLSPSEPKPKSDKQTDVSPTESSNEPYLRALENVFNIENKNRSSLIVEFAKQQKWKEAQEQVQHLAFGAEKFASDKLNQQVSELSEAVFKQDETALTSALAQLN
ncbi:hypothetical protein SNR37_001818 [Agarivorans aestuarii]|uniref:Uncharacterized protein n=1 Tax=Agarivorans aestuarii TaxID=1563703 RepID=A0ABU7G012_9ALTE|nr:hypothetical protein [Agarivorans aestuarii]MEE1672489.1 hypothetical protein [Agarivorans aestuarii]